jgi:hypothetical protein
VTLRESRPSWLTKANRDHFLAELDSPTDERRLQSSAATGLVPRSPHLIQQTPHTTPLWFDTCVLIPGLACQRGLSRRHRGHESIEHGPASDLVLFSAWLLFFLLQTTLAALGRVNRHRAWGLLGVSLATAMVFVGFAVANHVLAARLAAGFGDRARAFHIASISMITLFGVFVFAAIAYVARPEIHKRLMLLATISIIPPAIARLFFAVNAGIGSGLRPGLGPPRSVESVMAPALVADALILAGVIYDVRMRGRPHPAYLIGGAIIVVVQVLRMPMSATQAWYAIADFLARFSG